MRGFICFMCGVAETAAIGSIVSLGVSPGVAVVLLLIPMVLLALSFWVPSWVQVVQKRRGQVYVYVPPEQRRYSGEVYRPFVEQGQGLLWDEEEWQ